MCYFQLGEEELCSRSQEEARETRQIYVFFVKSRGETLLCRKERFETLKDALLCKTLICEDNSLLNQSGVCSHYKPKGSIYKISTTLYVLLIMHLIISQ